MKPAKRRARVRWIHETFQISIKRACRLAGFSRAGWYKRSVAKDQSALRMRLRELAHGRASAICACMCCSDAKDGS